MERTIVKFLGRVPVRKLGAIGLVFSVLVALPVFAEGAGCVKHEPHSGLTFLLVDRTDKHDEPRIEALKQTFLAVREMVQPGERIVVGVSTGKASDTRVVVDLVHPKNSWLESALKTKAKQREFTECITGAEKTLLEHIEEYKTSAILETLSFVGKIVHGATGAARVVMFSDMVENGPQLSFIKGDTIDLKKAIETVKKEKLVYDFKGIPFYVAGVGQGVSDKKAGQLEEFWKAYFTDAGADLKFFGPIFLGP